MNEAAVNEEAKCVSDGNGRCKTHPTCELVQRRLQTQSSLIEYAIKNLVRNHPRRYRGMVLWGLVSDIFGLGSTSSCELCLRFNIDPHQKLK